jgi:hypothetical protein
MKGKENRKESKKEKSAGGKTKVLTDYQREKESKQDSVLNLKPKL